VKKNIATQPTKSKKIIPNKSKKNIRREVKSHKSTINLGAKILTNGNPPFTKSSLFFAIFASSSISPSLTIPFLVHRMISISCVVG